MKQNNFLEDLHIGEIIKEIAQQKNITSVKIATAINRYQQNSNKIFKLNDMNVEDVIILSFFLEINILSIIARKYLTHLPLATSSFETEFNEIRIVINNRQSKQISILNTRELLEKIHIGQYIRKIAKKKELNEQNLAKQLDCSQSTVNDIYKRKSLKVKKLIQISNVLQYNFIANIYLSLIDIVAFTNTLANCIITLTPQQIHITNLNDKAISMIFQRNSNT